MKCLPRWQLPGARHPGVQWPWHCCRTICTYTNSVMHDLHTIGSAAL